MASHLVKMHIHPSILDLIGHTPVVQLKKIPINDIPEQVKIYAKLEFFNPSGSVKDRMAKYMIEYAEQEGLLEPGGVIVENSSGNTGSALAMISAVKGYKCIITMPDKMSEEKKNMMRAFGAEVIVTPTEVPPDSEQSYYARARQIAKDTPNSYYPNQYNNLKNIEAHYKTTGPEIWEQMEGKIDILIAGVGTGGTLSGVGQFLKERNPKIKIIAVDPKGSVFYDYFKYKKIIQPHIYALEGIGEDCLVKALDFSVIDDILQVSDKDAFLMTRRLTREEGLFVGGSSGAALTAALDYVKSENIKGPTNILVILPDSGNRYLSKIFNDSWMKEKGFF